MTVRVVSYNLLVPLYATQPGHFFKSQSQFLKTDYRWNLIQTQLEQEIVQHENTIICLQELGLSMISKLELFFHRLKYCFFYNLYGGRKGDYMGVGIAIPTSMKLNNISYIKIGDHIRSICKRLENTSSLLTWGRNLYQYTLSKFIQVPSDPWEMAIDKKNTLIYLQVVIDDKILCIGTYHMPCAFKEPSVMAIHSSVVKDLMFQLANGNDFILAGDFNLKPRDTCYHALTEKGYIDIHFPESSTTYDVSYHPNTAQALKSAYREKNGSEPIYTNFSYTSRSPRFCETIDYIFFTGKLIVEDIMKLPDEPVGESYPDETHPSDHLMIAATFQLS